MHFHEAREKFRELEAKFFSGELAEGDFLDQVAQLRVTDTEGREWIISARNGRWLVHDGRQWVFAEPPQEGEMLAAVAKESRPEPVVPLEPQPKPRPKPQPQPKKKPRPTPRPQPQPKPKRAAEAAPSRARAPRQARAERPSPAATEKPQRKPVTWPRLRIPFGTTRVLSGTLSALLIVACVVAVGVSAWVLFLRDLGEPDSVSFSGESSSVAPVVTYTPRPATPTYTPTATPTPSRTSTPTITPPATNTARPTLSPTPTETAPPTAPPAPTAQTHTVVAGETLSEIAARFGVSTEALARANGISDPALIRDGQVLVIPSPSATPTWTPIVLAVVSRTATATATPSPTVARASRTPTATAAVTATATRRPKKTPKPTATTTPKPVALSGKIAFTVWNTALGKYELYVSLIDGSGRNMLGQGYRQPQFRQDGNMLAVNGDGKPNFEHLVRMDSNGGSVVEISNFSEDAFPTWSPDGNIVAFSSLAYGDGQSRLGIVHDIFGKNQNWIRIGTTEIRGEYPFWMPDGRVVYHGCAFLTDHAACGLFWVGAGGGDYYRLTTDSSDTAPAGFGSRVAFMSLRDGDWDVYTVNMDGSSLKRLTDNSAQDGLPTWSPDGRSIAFVSDRGGAWAIWAMDANGGNQRKLFDLGGGFGSGNYDWVHERISWAP